jgi:hypothetical protein
MPHTDGDDAAEEIQVLVIVGVIDELVFGALHHQRRIEVVEYRRKQVFPIG